MQDDYPKHSFFKVEKVIEKVLKQNNLQDVLYFSRILKHWDVIVGSPLSKKTSPIKLENRVLFIGVADSAYSHTLHFYVPKIIELIASPEICGEGVVKKITFRTVSKPKISNSKQEPLPPAVNQHMLSEPDQTRVEETSLRIKDERLQKQFSRYMGKVISK